MLSVETPASEQLLPLDRTILERPAMAFPPFGADEQGNKITDVSGTHVLACLEYLEESVSKIHGPEAGKRAAADLCHLLNARIRDSAYHVTPAFLRNVWNSYSYEFLCYLREFCKQLSGDPHFHYSHAYAKLISPLFQTLTRPFSLKQIYKMGPYWAQKYTKGAVEAELVSTAPRSVTWRLRFTAQTRRQFGPYLRACAHQVCEAIKGRMASAPCLIHGMPPATVHDRTCIARGDEWCEWEITWQHEPGRLGWCGLWSALAGVAVFAYLWLVHPEVDLAEALLIALTPLAVSWLTTRHSLHRISQSREAVIHEQLQFIEARHEELREAYVEQERTRVALRHKVNQLTALYRAGLLYNSTLDREALVQTVLETLIHDLHYGRAMISFYDPIRQVLHQGRALGVSDEIAEFVRGRELPLSDPDGFPASALRQGKPLLINDIRSIWDRLHPLNQRLAELTGTTSLIWVPLQAKGRILGTLTVDRTAPESLTADDLELMVTVGNQIAIALDNAAAYAQIEQLNVGLEAKVRERTAELERADRFRSLFLSHVSHELRTPLTSVKGFVENLLDGLTGPLNPKQERYLGRIVDNVDRLIRMISDLLDRTRIETGQLSLTPTEIDLQHCIAEVVEQLRPLATDKHQTVTADYPSTPLILSADRDRLIQIVTNLVHNAIKFTPLDGAISVHVSSENASAVIRIRDTGPGIPTEFLEKVFDPFFRTAQGRHSGTKGLGLGLSIVKTLVDLHHGHISVGSEPGRGTEFRVTLPLIPASPMTPVRTLAAAKRLLIVDDDPDIRQLLSDRLQADGFEVETAIDGTQALLAIERGQFCGVLLDIGIPQHDGLEVLRRVRQWNQQIPIVIVTASDAKNLAIYSISLGAQAYLLKPFDLPELQQVIGNWFTHA